MEIRANGSEHPGHAGELMMKILSGSWWIRVEPRPRRGAYVFSGWRASQKPRVGDIQTKRSVQTKPF